ncbi:MAG TPA: helix-turn-helix domain-containing protein [Vicinamibacterales bacterium]|nr:helix-turn-helix domain-containing protein [Vicinamibacterales bacterium]
MARRVFAERGFRGATTRQIAAAAGVTEALIFQHFPDKDSLYAAILDLQATTPSNDEWLTALEACDPEDEAAVIRMLYTGLIAQHERDPDLLRLMVFSALEDHPLCRHLHGRATRLYRFLETFIRRGQRAGRFRPGSAAFLARATIALPIHYILQRQLFKTPWPPLEIADMIESGVAFTLAGLRGAGVPGTETVPPQVAGEVRA